MTLEIEKRFQNRREALLKKIEELLAFYDWDGQLIKQAEAECGFAHGYSGILFPDGIAEIIQMFEKSKDQQMLRLLMSAEAPLKIREKISKALKVRIKNCSPKLVLKKNRRFLCAPVNLSLAAKLAWESCDKIWRYAGDNSTDFNHYSKRGLLVSVYASAIIFYINDESEEATKTDNYIDENLAKIINIANFKNIIKLPKLEDIPILRLFS